MPRRLLVDVHMHIYESKAQGQHRKAVSPIVEYGAGKPAASSTRAGDLADALVAMREAAFSYAVVLNLMYTLPSDDGVLEKAPGSSNGQNVLHNAAAARDRLVSYNRWVCELSLAHPQFVPFVSLDPWVMSPQEMSTHLREMVSRFNARGVKIHPIAQRFAADDERMWPLYRTCAELGVPVLAHSGASAACDFAEPRTFSRVLTEFPTLKMILAHLGGGAWRQTMELAAAHPNVLFDSCEIIAWAGAPNAPTQHDLANLISEIGPSRVLMGSDFPWYDLDRTAQQVLALPILSNEEKELILGQNAASLLSLRDTASFP